MVRPATPSDPTQLVIRRTYDSPVPRVYAAWTDSEQLPRWLRPTEEIAMVSAEVDLRVGGYYRFAYKVPGEASTNIVGGKYREIVPYEKISFTWKWEVHPDFQDEETLVTVEFRDLGGQTELTLTHRRFPTEVMCETHAWGGLVPPTRWSSIAAMFAKQFPTATARFNSLATSTS